MTGPHLTGPGQSAGPAPHFKGVCATICVLRASQVFIHSTDRWVFFLSRYFLGVLCESDGPCYSIGGVLVNKMGTSPLSHRLVGEPQIYYVIQVESAGRRKCKV